MTPSHSLPLLMVAPNSARRGKADRRALQITLEEIVETAVTCRKAGEDGIQLHAHDEEGNHSLDTGLLYQEAIAALENAVPGLFLQVTNETTGRYCAGARREGKRASDLRPDA